MKLIFLRLAIPPLLPAASQAKWKPQYASNSPEIRDWYKSRKLTDAAAKRFAFKSCCDGSDKVETQFKVDKATGDDKWYYQKGLRVGRSAAGRNLVGRTLSHRGSRAVLPYTASRPASSLREGGCDGFASPPRRRPAANSPLPLLHYRLRRRARSCQLSVTGRCQRRCGDAISCRARVPTLCPRAGAVSLDRDCF